MSDTTFKRGQIVRHRLNKMEMIVTSTNDEGEQISCKWFKEKEQYWTTDYFYPEELEAMPRK